MKINNTVLIFLFSFLLVFFYYTPAGSFQADVFPSEINPGDAFRIKVSGAKTSEIPSAVLNIKQITFSRCGKSCFVAIGSVSIETKPGEYLIRLAIGNESRDIKLVVKEAIFPEQHLTLPDKKVFLSPEDLQRAQREAKRLKLIWPGTTERLWSGKFVLPLENDISTVFGVKRIINKKKNSSHRGIDIKGKRGERVKASNRGRVILADKLFFGGKTVVLDHGDGIYTIYMHLSEVNVKHDAVVSKGDIIGFVGSTGRATGPHLHFGVKVLEINTNPVSFVRLQL
jgi:murein DD-endopeptidase MepM/ murein hydrolase activator NlpD